MSTMLLTVVYLLIVVLAAYNPQKDFLVLLLVAGTLWFSASVAIMTVRYVRTWGLRNRRNR